MKQIDVTKMRTRAKLLAKLHSEEKGDVGKVARELLSLCSQDSTYECPDCEARAVQEENERVIAAAQAKH